MPKPKGFHGDPVPTHLTGMISSVLHTVFPCPATSGGFHVAPLAPGRLVAVVHRSSSAFFSLLQLEQMAEESHHSLALLQSQLEDYKEKSRKELGDSQKQAKDRGAELEKAQFSLARLQDEVWSLLQRGIQCSSWGR